MVPQLVTTVRISTRRPAWFAGPSIARAQSALCSRCVCGLLPPRPYGHIADREAPQRSTPPCSIRACSTTTTVPHHSRVLWYSLRALQTWPYRVRQRHSPGQLPSDTGTHRRSHGLCRASSRNKAGSEITPPLCIKSSSINSMKI